MTNFWSRHLRLVDTETLLEALALMAEVGVRYLKILNTKRDPYLYRLKKRRKVTQLSQNTLIRKRQPTWKRRQAWDRPRTCRSSQATKRLVKSSQLITSLQSYLNQQVQLEQPQISQEIQLTSQLISSLIVTTGKFSWRLQKSRLLESNETLRSQVLKLGI